MRQNLTVGAERVEGGHRSAREAFSLARILSRQPSGAVKVFRPGGQILGKRS